MDRRPQQRVGEICGLASAATAARRLGRPRIEAVRPKLVAERAAIDAEGSGPPGPGCRPFPPLPPGAGSLPPRRSPDGIAHQAHLPPCGRRGRRPGRGRTRADWAACHLRHRHRHRHRSPAPAAPDWPSPRVRPSDTLSRLLPRRAICNHGGMVPARADRDKPPCTFNPRTRAIHQDGRSNRFGGRGSRPPSKQSAGPLRRAPATRLKQWGAASIVSLVQCRVGATGRSPLRRPGMHAPPGLSGYASDQPDLWIPKRIYPTSDE